MLDFRESPGKIAIEEESPVAQDVEGCLGKFSLAVVDNLKELIFEECRLSARNTELSRVRVY
jgi:hypothetical protein